MGGSIILKTEGKFMIRRRFNNAACLCLLAGSLVAGNTAAVAQTYSGGSLVSGNWSTAGNWVLGQPPSSGINTQIHFSTNSSGHTPNQNIANPFVLNRLTFGVNFPSGSVDGSRLQFQESGANVLPRIQTDSAAAVNTIQNDVTLASATTVAVAGTLTMSGVINGNGTITKTGEGALRLSNSNVLFTGGTQIEQGTVLLLNSNALQNSTVDVGVHNGLGFVSLSSATIGGLAGTGNIFLGSMNVTVGGNNQSTGYSGILSGAGSITKTGSGAWTLSGDHTLGTLSVTGGSIVLGTSNTLANTAVSVTGSDRLNFGALGSATLGSLAGSGNVNFGTTGLTVGGNGGSTTYSGQLTSSTARFNKTGGGEMRLTGTGSVINGLDVNGGQLVLDGGSMSLTSQLDVNVADLRIENGGHLQLAGFGIDDVDHSGGATMTITGAGSQVTGSSYFVVGITGGTAVVEDGGHLGTNSLAVGVIGQGDLTVRTGGTLTATGPTGVGTQTNGNGLLTISGQGTTATLGQFGVGGISGSERGGTGTVVIADAATVTAQAVTLWTAPSTITVDRATLSVRDLRNFDGVQSTIAISDPQAGVSALSIGGNSGGGTTYSGLIVDHVNGAGSVTKTGSNTVTLSGANTYSGGTTVAAGRLVITGDQNLGASGSALRLSGGTLEVTASMSTARPVVISSGGTIDSSQTLTFTSGISGSGTMVKAGSGRMIMEGNNAAFTGTFRIDDGILEASHLFSLYSGIDIHLNGQATMLQVSNASGIGSLSGSGTAVFNSTVEVGGSGFGGTFSGSITGSGGLVKQGGETWTLSGSGLYGGATTIAAGTLNLQGGVIAASSSTLLQSGAHLTGFGQVNGPFTGQAASTVSAQGLLVLGSPGSTSGFSHAGQLDVGVASVILQDANAAELTGTTQLAGGSLFAANGIALGGSATITGTGTVLAPISGSENATITATGLLSLGQATRTDGFAFDGTLNVGSHRVILQDADLAELGILTSLAGGGTLNAVAGASLAAGRVLGATGSARIDGQFVNNGTVNGPTGTGQYLTFDDDVSGAGNYTGNIEFRQGFSPGNSPGLVTIDGDVLFTTTTTLDLELAGVVRGSEYDAVDIDGHLFAGGTVRFSLLDGFMPTVGDEFVVLTFSTVSGDFQEYEGLDLGDDLWLQPSWTGSGLSMTVVAVPEPSVAWFLAPLVVGLAIRSRLTIRPRLRKCR